MLTTIAIEGFKSRKSQTLPLNRINVVIGANGAGKSSAGYPHFYRRNRDIGRKEKGIWQRTQRKRFVRRTTNFVNKALGPYLSSRGITLIPCTLVTKNDKKAGRQYKGGIVNYPKAKKLLLPSVFCNAFLNMPNLLTALQLRKRSALTFRAKNAAILTSGLEDLKD
jgi:hypothetical protein